MSSNLFDIVKSISNKFDNSLLEIVYDFDENIKINFAHNDLKNIIINILSTMVEFAKKILIRESYCKYFTANRRKFR